MNVPLTGTRLKNAILDLPSALSQIHMWNTMKSIKDSRQEHESAKEFMENEDEGYDKKRKSDIGNRLAEIVKYANMYPIRRRQVLTTSYDYAKKNRKTKLHFGDKLDHLCSQRKIRPKQAKRELKIGDPNLVFKFFNEETDAAWKQPSEQSEFLRKIPKKVKQVKKLIKNYRQGKEINLKTEGSSSIYSFIREEVNDAKLRKTQISSMKFRQSRISSFQKSTNIDIRQENIGKVLRFVNGSEIKDEDLISDYISLRKVENQRKNFALYERIYDSVSKELKGKKLQIDEMMDQTIRNTIYIKENLKIQGNHDRKRELKDAMKRLHIIND